MLNLSVDYNCCCFKIINKHYLKFVEARENYVSKHYKDKSYSIKNFYKIWRLNSQKLNDYLEVIVIEKKKKMHIKRYAILLEEHLKRKFPKIKINFFVSRRTKLVHMALDIALFLFSTHNSIVSEILEFMKEKLDDKWKTIFPTLVSTIRWKYD